MGDLRKQVWYSLVKLLLWNWDTEFYRKPGSLTWQHHWNQRAWLQRIQAWITHQAQWCVLHILLYLGGLKINCKGPSIEGSLFNSSWSISVYGQAVIIKEILWLSLVWSLMFMPFAVFSHLQRHLETSSPAFRNLFVEKEQGGKTIKVGWITKLPAANVSIL